MKYQSKGIINKIMFAQCGETGDDEGKTKYKKQEPQIKLDHIDCNDYG